MILVRHAKSIVVPAVPAAQWELAPDAAAAAAALGARLSGVTTVVSSDESKAMATAAALGLGDPTPDDEFREVTRPFYDDADELTRAVAAWFAGTVVPGWETFADAVGRFDHGLGWHAPEGLVVVTHGTVMTAWLQARGLLDDAFAFWRDLRMPDAWTLSPTLTRCP